MGICVAGLDLSATGTGIAIISGDGTIHTSTVGYPLKKSDSEWRRLIRYLTIANQIIKTFQEFGVKAACIEDYAFSRKSSSTHVLAELGGVVKTQVFMVCKITPVTCPSSSLRKFVFGENVKDKKEIKKLLATRGYHQPVTLDESDALVAALVADAYTNKRTKYSHLHELDLFNRFDERLIQ